MNQKEKKLVEALQEIMSHMAMVAGPVLCKTNFVWKRCDQVLHDHEIAELIEARTELKIMEVQNEPCI